MFLKEAAFQLNLTQTKVKEVSQVVFGYIPNEFSEDDLSKIKQHLALTSDSKVLVASVESQVNGEIAQSSPVNAMAVNLKNIASQGAKLERLREIVSGKSYQANLELWRGYISFQLNQALTQQEQILLLFREQSKRLTGKAFDDMTSDIKKAIVANSGAWISLVAGDFTEQLKALSEMEINLERTDSTYEQNLRDAVDELISLK